MIRAHDGLGTTRGTQTTMDRVRAAYLEMFVQCSDQHTLVQHFAALRPDARTQECTYLITAHWFRYLDQYDITSYILK